MKIVLKGFAVLTVVLVLAGYAAVRYQRHAGRCASGHIEIRGGERYCVDAAPRAFGRF